MSQQEKLIEAAQLLFDAQAQHQTCQPIREIIGETDIESAYAIQRINIDKRIANGAIRVGAKIGLTSLAVQKQLGVDQPDFGVLLSGTQVAKVAVM